MNLRVSVLLWLWRSRPFQISAAEGEKVLEQCLVREIDRVLF